LADPVSTSVTGNVIYDSGGGIAGLVVIVRDESRLFSRDLGNAVTADTTGAYTVSIEADLFPEVGVRQLGIYVRTGVYKNLPSGKKVPAGRLLGSTTTADTAGDVLTVEDIKLRQVDVTGWPVSLPGTTNALPVRNGNALRPLPDDQAAWQRVATSVGGAQQSVSVMQLTLDMPRGYQADATQEFPEVVLAFPASFDGTTPPTKGVDPVAFPRLERLLLAAASAGQQARVMIPALGNWAASAGFWLKQHLSAGPKGDADAVGNYFTAAGSSAEALSFTTHGFSVVHAKAVLIDATAAGTEQTEGILLGSPFEQSYWDTPSHAVYEAQRGSCSGEPVPVHDVSIGVRGPLVADLQQQFMLHWNKYSKATDTVAALDPVPAEITAAGDGEYLATAQLARTVNIDTLTGLDQGEEGILEAYLRAIEQATEYIYIENQYFTNPAIGDALIAALTDPGRPNLQVILMLNVVPDITFYPAWQTSLFGRIGREAGAASSRFGVFTAWSQVGPSPAHHQAKPVIMPHYLHTKTAVIDGKWATIGSANLDGASLDQFQILQPLLGVNRNDELNVLVFNDTTAGFTETPFVDALRVALWSEHLGIPADDPRLSATALAGNNGWLQLWNDCATAKLQGLIDDPSTIDPSVGQVLAYPAGAWSGFLAALPFTNNYKNFLNSAKIGDQGIDLSKVTLVTQTTAYSFHDGKWADALCPRRSTSRLRRSAPRLPTSRPPWTDRTARRTCSPCLAGTCRPECRTLAWPRWISATWSPRWRTWRPSSTRALPGLSWTRASCRWASRSLTSCRASTPWSTASPERATTWRRPASSRSSSRDCSTTA
jgi:phosphatidylserine/phosphatidylglycerophosphate/cardiolipin synthase-like enzyme